MNIYQQFGGMFYCHDYGSGYQQWIDLKKHRRVEASARERRRRIALNSALEELRQRVSRSHEGHKRLSKMEVLLMARDYICLLSECLANSSMQPDPDCSVPNRHEQVLPDVEYHVHPDPVIPTSDHCMEEAPDLIYDEYRCLSSPPDLLWICPGGQDPLPSQEFSHNKLYMP